MYGFVCLEEMSYVHKVHFYSSLYTTSFSPEDGGDMFFRLVGIRL
jgi:hypothetical protein